MVQNDHKPLEMIQQKPTNVAPSHLQQMLLHMQKYDYTIQYKPGKEIVLAKCLSHFPPTVTPSPFPSCKMSSISSYLMLNWTSL